MGPQPTFRFQLLVPRALRLDGRAMDREGFFGWLWNELSSQGLLGVHEGTLLSEEAAAAGLETESFTVDAALAPRERDWIGGQAIAVAELYFDTEAAATRAREMIGARTGLDASPVERIEPQDWDAEWKASYQGISLPPFWEILPPWAKPELGFGGNPESGRVVLRLNPGAGFGTGTHETTQLCLQVLGEQALKRPSRDWSGARVLDFGSGSGILAIGAALLGAQVRAVEIDPLAVENSVENAKLNQVESRIEHRNEMGQEEGPYALVLANILKPVLLEFASELTDRVGLGGLILSGLVEADVIPVLSRFSQLLPGWHSAVRSKGEWRAIWLERS